MPNRRAKIDKALHKYGSDVVLNYKPLTARADADGDWPDPLTPTRSPPQSSVIRAILVPLTDVEYRDVVATGVVPSEKVQAFFSATQELNNVASVGWQGNLYRILQQDAYELSGSMLVQVAMLERTMETVPFPHA